MISEIDKKIIKELSEKYHLKKVLIFGSSLDPNRESRDIDIAIEGIPPGDFLDYYGDLLLKLSNNSIQWTVAAAVRHRHYKFVSNGLNYICTTLLRI